VDEQTKNDVRQTASDAAQQGREVASDAADHARELASSAREQTAEVTREAVHQGQRVLSDATDKVREQAHVQADQAVSALRGLSDQARALAEGRPQEAGPLGDYAQRLAGSVSQAADRLEQRGIEGSIDDLKRFARRRPGVFLLGAGIAGFAAGRLLRGARDDDRGPASSYGNGQQVAYAPPRQMAGAGTGGSSSVSGF
jgi:hypothetical protein